MKIVFLSYSDYKGGASIAAHAIYRSIKIKNSVFLSVDNKYKYSEKLYSFFGKIYISFLRVLEKIIIFFFL